MNYYFGFFFHQYLIKFFSIQYIAFINLIIKCRLFINSNNFKFSFYSIYCKVENSEFSANGVQTWLAAGLTDQLLETVLDRLDGIDDSGPHPVILCSSPLTRAAFKQLSHDRCPQLVAMSLEEISRDTQVESLGQVQISLAAPHLQAA